MSESRKRSGDELAPESPKRKRRDRDVETACGTTAEAGDDFNSNDQRDEAVVTVYQQESEKAETQKHADIENCQQHDGTAKPLPVACATSLMATPVGPSLSTKLAATQVESDKEHACHSRSSRQFGDRDDRNTDPHQDLKGTVDSTPPVTKPLNKCVDWHLVGSPTDEELFTAQASRMVEVFDGSKVVPAMLMSNHLIQSFRDCAILGSEFENSQAQLAFQYRKEQKRLVDARSRLWGIRAEAEALTLKAFESRQRPDEVQLAERYRLLREEKKALDEEKKGEAEIAELQQKIHNCGTHWNDALKKCYPHFARVLLDSGLVASLSPHPVHAEKRQHDAGMLVPETEHKNADPAQLGKAPQTKDDNGRNARPANAPPNEVESEKYRAARELRAKRIASVLISEAYKSGYDKGERLYVSRHANRLNADLRGEFAQYHLVELRKRTQNITQAVEAARKTEEDAKKTGWLKDGPFHRGFESELEVPSNLNADVQGPKVGVNRERIMEWAGNIGKVEKPPRSQSIMEEVATSGQKEPAGEISITGHSESESGLRMIIARRNLNSDSRVNHETPRKKSSSDPGLAYTSCRNDAPMPSEEGSSPTESQEVNGKDDVRLVSREVQPEKEHSPRKRDRVAATLIKPLKKMGWKTPLIDPPSQSTRSKKKKSKEIADIQTQKPVDNPANGMEDGLVRPGGQKLSDRIMGTLSCGDMAGTLIKPNERVSTSDTANEIAQKGPYENGPAEKKRLGAEGGKTSQATKFVGTYWIKDKIRKFRRVNDFDLEDSKPTKRKHADDEQVDDRASKRSRDDDNDNTPEARTEARLKQEMELLRMNKERRKEVLLDCWEDVAPLWSDERQIIDEYAEKWRKGRREKCLRTGYRSDKIAEKKAETSRGTLSPQLREGLAIQEV
ncbi:hypothetical protein BDV96DRAFT_598126 [Lophiotrema nucula]|uniref:Uncharacterized protein n=1 Tax=Lophiotrema nucula TaxID=690887 RepID=A0A6A5ZCJ0_9PLEO|nr:hypothetical protein BDV96DRAFT_598126 [Lophiotrema nucula]